MLQPVFTTSFQKDVKRVEKRGYDMEKLKEVIKLILLKMVCFLFLMLQSVKFISLLLLPIKYYLTTQQSICMMKELLV